MSSPVRSNTLFLSQKIEIGAPPLLLPPGQATNKGQSTINSKPTEEVFTAQGYIQEEQATTNNEPVTWQWKIEASLIPSLNMYYLLEPTSLTLKQIPIALVQSRLSDFLRIQSIAYTYKADYVRLDCVTDSMLKFCVQFWRVGGGPDNERFEDPNKAITVELQRRQGSVVEMQSIRKKMFRALLTGEQPSSDEKPRLPPLPDTIMAEVDDGYDHDAGLADAFDICLRLLESRCIDQSRLGLESLKMLTEAAIVSRRDALVVSRAIVFREGEYGERLQVALAGHFGVVVAADSDMMEYETTASRGMALSVLANALQLVLEDKANEKPISFEATSPFWALVTQDLYNNVERATMMPHEGAKSAKCIRLLNDLQSRTRLPTIRQASLRSCLAQAQQWGQHCHLSLERESSKLLSMDTRAH